MPRPEDARRLALEELDGEDALARRLGALRQARIPPPLPDGPARGGLFGGVLHDLRYAARMLRKQPGFTIAAVLTLALGIGANAAVFSLVNATLFQRLPVPERDRLVYVNRGTGGVFSYPQYEALRDHAPSFEALAGWGGITASLHAGDSAELVSGFIVTGNFFDVLGIQAARGRLLSRVDDQTPGAHPVAVISYEFWQARFGWPAGRHRPRDTPQRPRVHDRRRHAGRIPRAAGRRLPPALRADDDAGDHAAAARQVFRRAEPGLAEESDQQLDLRHRAAETRRDDRAGGS